MSNFTIDDVLNHTEEKPTNVRFEDLEGKLFGDITVLKYYGKQGSSSSWFCKCSYGNLCIKQTSKLKRGSGKCHDCSLKKLSEDKKIPTEHYENLIKLRFPFYRIISRGCGAKDYWTLYCPVCNTPFKNKPCNILRSVEGSCRCNLKKFDGWTQKLREFQIKSVSSEMGLIFLGWEDEYVNTRSKLFVKCSKHKHYKVSVGNLLQGFGCQECFNESRGDHLRHGIDKFIKDAQEIHGDNFNYDDYEYKCSRTPSTISCNSCGNKFNSSYDNHVNKRQGCPSCKGKNQKQLYLCSLEDDGLLVGYKYGIAVDSIRRLHEHQKVCKYSVKLLRFWTFNQSVDCKSAELKLKNFCKGLDKISKFDMEVGFTETIYHKDYVEFEKLLSNLTRNVIEKEIDSKAS